MEELSSSKKEQKTFWKLLDKLNYKPRENTNSISGKIWETHFKSILRYKKSLVLPFPRTPT